MWLGKAEAAGFAEVEILSRRPMGEDRLPFYPVYREGGLDALFARVPREDRWRLAESATIRAVKPRKPGQAGATPSIGAGCPI